MAENSKVERAFWALRLTLGVSAFLAGADKFTNLLTDWRKYISPKARKRLPVSGGTFMRMAGVIEMLVGVGILSPRHRLSSYAASAWLLAIAGDLIMNDDYDIAVRDVNMAVAAFALGQLSAAHERRVKEQETLDYHSEAA